MRKPVTSKPAPKKAANSSSTRWNEEDLQLMELLRKDTGISTNSQLQRFCLHEVAKARGLK